MGRGLPDRRRKPWRKTRALVTSGIGDRIRQLREQLGLTQTQLGDGVLSGRYISAVETEAVRPSGAALDHIARRLGTTAVALGMLPPNAPSVEPLAGLSQAVGFVRAIRTTDPRERELVSHVEWVLLSAFREVALPTEGDLPSQPAPVPGPSPSEADAP